MYNETEKDLELSLFGRIALNSVFSFGVVLRCITALPVFLVVTFFLCIIMLMYKESTSARIDYLKGWAKSWINVVCRKLSSPEFHEGSDYLLHIIWTVLPVMFYFAHVTSP